MNKTNQLICAHSAVLLALASGIGAFLLPGWLPPPSPNLSTAEIAAVFNPDNILMRIGVSLVAFCGPLVAVFSAAIATQLKRIEGRSPTLANMQLLASGFTAMFFMIPGFIWLAISFRVDGSPDVIRTLNDLSWFMFLAASGPFAVQTLGIALCILGDRSGAPVCPRWLSYVNVWNALAAMPGVLIPFFKTGPFAWDGIFGFWLIATDFFIWLACNYWCTLQAIRNQRP